MLVLQPNCGKIFKKKKKEFIDEGHSQMSLSLARNCRQRLTDPCNGTSQGKKKNKEKKGTDYLIS